MLTTTIFQLALVIGISHAWPTTLDGALKRADHVLGSTGCRALYAALPDAVFSASSTQYTSESEGKFDATGSHDSGRSTDTRDSE